MTQRAVLIGGANVSVHGQGPGFYSGMGSMGMASFRIRVLGYSFSGVEALARDLKERLERIPRVRDVDIGTTSFGYGGGEKAFAITIEPNRAVLAQYGLTAQDLTYAVGREIRGAAGQMRLEIGGEEINVRLKTSGSRERTLNELRDAMIPTPSGGSVRLSAVSNVSEREALSTISREDQQFIRVVAYEFRGPNKLAQRTHDAFMKTVSTPPGYTVEDAAYSFYGQDKSEQGLWLVFSIGIVLVILSVALVFDSVWAAGVVFASLPVALGGVVADLLAGQRGIHPRGGGRGDPGGGTRGEPGDPAGRLGAPEAARQPPARGARARHPSGAAVGARPRGDDRPGHTQHAGQPAPAGDRDQDDVAVRGDRAGGGGRDDGRHVRRAVRGAGDAGGAAPAVSTAPAAVDYAAPPVRKSGPVGRSSPTISTRSAGKRRPAERHASRLATAHDRR